MKRGLHYITEIIAYWYKRSCGVGSFISLMLGDAVNSRVMGAFASAREAGPMLNLYIYTVQLSHLTVTE